MKKLSFLVALMMCAHQSAVANPSLATQNLLQASLNQANLDTQEGRLSLVKSVNQYCSELQKAYPTNSPAEDQWLSREIAGGGDRPYKVISTAEFGRRTAKVFIDECLRSSEWAEKAPDKTIYLIVLTHVFAKYSGDAALYAKRNGVDADKFALEFAPRSATEALAYAAIKVEIEQK